jgi:hypothetical protein
MILCIPHHPRITDYAKFSLALRKLGTNPSHSLVVISNREHEEAAFEFQMGLVDGYLSGKSVVVPDIPGETPMQFSNRMFLAAMKTLDTHVPGPSEHPKPVMVYFDPTWKPFANRWLDDLQGEYYLNGAPLTMARFETRGDGLPVTAGPVMFAKGFPQHSRLLAFLMDSGKHWREFLAWEIVNSAVKTDTIGRNKAASIRPQPTEK